MRQKFVHIKKNTLSIWCGQKQQRNTGTNSVLWTIPYEYRTVIQATEQLRDLLTACEQAVSRPVWHIPLLCVQWITPEDGQRNCPKHVEFYSKNKFEKISASSWFYYKEFFTMNGHMNVKLRYMYTVRLYTVRLYTVRPPCSYLQWLKKSLLK